MFAFIPHRGMNYYISKHQMPDVSNMKWLLYFEILILSIKSCPTRPLGDEHLVHMQPPHAGAGASGSDSKKLSEYKDHRNVHKRLDRYTYSATESW